MHSESVIVFVGVGWKMFKAKTPERILLMTEMKGRCRYPLGHLTGPGGA